MDDLFLFCLVFIFLLLEQFFAVSESAFISLDHVKVKHLAEKGNKDYIRIEKFLKDPSKFLSTALIGTNLSVISSTVLLTSCIISAFGDWGQFIAPLVISPFILLFGEIIPKSYSYRNSKRIAELTVKLLPAFSFIFSPIIYVLSGITNVVHRILKLDKKHSSSKITREDLMMLIKMDRFGKTLEEPEKKMLDRIFDFREIAVKEVMVPLINVKSIKKNMLIDDLLEEARESNVSRYPVYEDRVDNIIGVLNIFDLFYANEEDKNIDSLVRSAYYIPETKAVDDLLREFRAKGIQMAIVVDEYGSSLGIVTLEDILEEVVGEIQDEYDDEERQAICLRKGVYMFDAQMEIDAINERFKLNIEKGDYETLGGFLISVFEKIPVTGERIQFHSNTYTIIKADERKIEQVMVKKK